MIRVECGLLQSHSYALFWWVYLWPTSLMSNLSIRYWHTLTLTLKDRILVVVVLFRSAKYERILLIFHPRYH